MKCQEIERIANAAETLKAIIEHSKTSECQNLHLRTEDCIPSCKTIDFSTNYKILIDMADKLELSEQIEHPSVENTQTPTPSTSKPLGKPSERLPTEDKCSQSVKLKLFPLSQPKIFDSKFLALLTIQDLVLKKNTKAIEEDQKQDITQLGNYYNPYINKLNVSAGCLYFDDGLVIPACLRSIKLHRSHEAHRGQFAMKSLAIQYIWWPKIYREIQVHGENCTECLKQVKT